MVTYRSVIAFVLMLLTTMLVSCSSVTETKLLSYTTAQVEEIQTYAGDLLELRDRLPELADLVQKENWTFVRNFIHGPLGELRTKMIYLSRNLLPNDQEKAAALAKETFQSLVALDAAAEKADYKVAVRNLSKTVAGLNDFLELVPKS
ncbi:photosystem II protein PsbQ [Leptolyngbya sp. FACHB-321]|uniref:photosystem II protein PsbQ n=1 Tax=Leptolyngbya sp. FACHB-321 TaxID=2692807 RepID=UPI0016873776|nr:photosystem II protein PsbQ [Leptolyngbya sp. FACHB-321]MBD2037314.1 photosystem II protein PsbQ [Leptolyngbya sp. FACHB-321]